MKKILIVCMSLGLTLISHAGWAEQAYVINTSKITLRNEPAVDQSIITMLEQDQPVELLGSNSGWSQVRLVGPGGKTFEGWVLSRFLTTQVPWKIRAIPLKKENSLLKENLTRLEKDWTVVSSREKELAQRLQENKAALEELQENYKALRAGSAGFLELKKKYESTNSSLKAAKEIAETLAKENEILRSSHGNEWFLTGGLVLFVGLVFGLIMGRQQRKKKASFY
ncbi:MAG: TIGR04211 family SH3 domain-containing protein [Pseudomonadota bacterium]